MKVQIQGILFDMDGILVSSLGSVERSWKKWGEMRGVDGSTAIKEAHGQRAIDTVRLLRPDLNDVDELKVIEDIEVQDKDDINVLEGVERVLDVLPQKSWTIVTSATERLARARLYHVGIRVPERIITADMVTLGKPNPEPYLRGAQLLGLRPDQCLVIEDSAAGARAGHAAGCKVLATLFSHSIEALTSADWIVNSLEDVRFRVLNDGIEIEFEPVAREVLAETASASH